MGVIVAGHTLEDRKLARRAVIAATTGNALEFYDFITFSFFAIQIGKVFFPSEDPFVSLMASLVTKGSASSVVRLALGRSVHGPTGMAASPPCC